MRQGIQTDFKYEELRKYGCYFFTLAAWVHLAFGIEFTDDELIEKYETYKHRRWIGPNSWIIEPALIFNDLADRPDYFRTVEHSRTAPHTIRFPVFFDGSPTHFALGSKFGNEAKVIWDSWRPSAESRGKVIHNYRSFR